jgi:hypothetical protein
MKRFILSTVLSAVFLAVNVTADARATSTRVNIIEARDSYNPRTERRVVVKRHQKIVRRTMAAGQPCRNRRNNRRHDVKRAVVVNRPVQRRTVVVKNNRQVKRSMTVEKKSNAVRDNR